MCRAGWCVGGWLGGWVDGWVFFSLFLDLESNGDRPSVRRLVDRSVGRCLIVRCFFLCCLFCWWRSVGWRADGRRAPCLSAGWLAGRFLCARERRKGSGSGRRIDLIGLDRVGSDWIKNRSL